MAITRVTSTSILRERNPGKRDKKAATLRRRLLLVRQESDSLLKPGKKNGLRDRIVRRELSANLVINRRKVREPGWGDIEFLKRLVGDKEAS